MAVEVGFLIGKRLLEFLLETPVASLCNVDAFILQKEGTFFDSVAVIENEL